MKMVWLSLGARWVRREREPVVPSVHVSLADPVIERARIVQRAMVALIASVGVVCAWWWWETERLRQVAEQLERATVRVLEGNRLFTAQLTREGLTAPPEALTAISEKVAFAKALAGKQAFSWSRLLADLEAVVPARTSIKTVALNFHDSRVSVRGEAQTLKDFNVLVESFQRHPAFREVVVSDHALQQQGELTDDGRIAFHLTVMYLGAKERSS
ncbi:MAG: PilN domain-containing protein [Nitrospira sp.]|nr:PilN domain-containing protein [Nitrospira sp.]